MALIILLQYNVLLDNLKIAQKWQVTWQRAQGVAPASKLSRSQSDGASAGCTSKGLSLDGVEPTGPKASAARHHRTPPEVQSPRCNGCFGGTRGTYTILLYTEYSWCNFNFSKEATGHLMKIFHQLNIFRVLYLVSFQVIRYWQFVMRPLRVIQMCKVPFSQCTKPSLWRLWGDTQRLEPHKSHPGAQGLSERNIKRVTQSNFYLCRVNKTVALQRVVYLKSFKVISMDQ